MVEWFNKKIKSQYLETDLLTKNQYERKHPMDCQRDKWVICKMLLKTDPLRCGVPNSDMPYSDIFSLNKNINF